MSFCPDNGALPAASPPPRARMGTGSRGRSLNGNEFLADERRGTCGTASAAYVLLWIA